MSSPTCNPQLELTGAGMTSNLSVTQILPTVRRTVLDLRSKTDGAICGFGLSSITTSVAFALGEPVRYASSLQPRMPFTSGSPKKLRGHVQAALTVLAREGVMFTRRKPESHPYHRPHCDKIYRVRISQAEATKRLGKCKSPSSS